MYIVYTYSVFPTRMYLLWDLGFCMVIGQCPPGWARYDLNQRHPEMFNTIDVTDLLDKKQI